MKERKKGLQLILRESGCRSPLNSRGMRGSCRGLLRLSLALSLLADITALSLSLLLLLRSQALLPSSHAVYLASESLDGYLDSGASSLVCVVCREF